MSSINDKITGIIITDKAEMYRTAEETAGIFYEAKEMHEIIEELYPHRKAIVI